MDWLNNAVNNWGNDRKPAADAAPPLSEAAHAAPPISPEVAAAAKSDAVAPVAGDASSSESRAAAASVSDGLASMLGLMGLNTARRATEESRPVAPSSSGDPALLNAQTEAMFAKMLEYTKLELDDTSDELLLLEQMNQHTAARYAELASTAEGLGAFSSEMQQKFTAMAPVLEEIDGLDAAIAELEGVVEQFDLYTRRLEAKAKALPR